MSTFDFSSFLAKHDFLIRRLHSLTGIFFGGYMIVHLLTNTTLLDGPATFQRNVYTIHSFGLLLPYLEWSLIFTPILFHGIVGLAILRKGRRNYTAYSYAGNIRYTLQRASGVVAFVFIVCHVFHTHGWFHFEAWRDFAERLGGANFRPYNAASSLAVAMSGFWTPLLYAIGIAACVFHFANGIWTTGITWGIWITPAAQQRASGVCLGLCVILLIVGAGALVGAKRVDVGTAREIEDTMIKMKLDTGELPQETAEHKRWTPEEWKHVEQVLSGESAAQIDDASPSSTIES